MFLGKRRGGGAAKGGGVVPVRAVAAVGKGD